MPKISVVIPLYNKETYISNTLRSVMNQTYDDYEIVIVDDGSTDNSVEVIKNSFSSDKIRIIKKENGGPSSARNRGVQEAHGEWIVFLDADDMLLPYALRCFSDMIEDEKCKGVKYFICNYYEKNGSDLKLFSNSRRKGIVRNKFFLEAARDLTERAGSAIINRNLLLAHPFDEKLWRYEDAECQYNLMRDNDIYVSPTPVMITDRDASRAAKARKNVSEDFIGNLEFEGKGYWEQMCLYVLALSGQRAYPEIKKTYCRQFRRKDLRVGFYLMRIWSIATNMIRNILYKHEVVSYEEILNATSYGKK